MYVVYHCIWSIIQVCLRAVLKGAREFSLQLLEKEQKVMKIYSYQEASKKVTLESDFFTGDFLPFKNHPVLLSIFI